MFKRVVIFLILIIILIFMVAINEGKKKGKHKTKFGPKAMSFNHSTNCAVFSKNARFNPYSVLFQRWFVFYYWALPQPPKTYLFTSPSSNLTKKLHKIFDGKVSKPVNWTSRLLLMEGPNDDVSLLVERGDRGQYWQYFIHRVDKELIAPFNVRLKQTSDGRLLGIMNCNRETVFVMSKINDVPPKHKLYEEASRLGYRSRRGKSYLYQGHEWLPIAEADDSDMWARDNEIDTNRQIMDTESVHLQNLVKEELDKFYVINESNKSQPIFKPIDTHCDVSRNTCQSIHAIFQTNKTKTSLEINIIDERVTNNSTNMSLLKEDHTANTINVLENDHSSKHQRSTDNQNEQDSATDSEGIQITNIYEMPQSSYNSDESTSTSDLNVLTSDTTNQFTDESIKSKSITEVEIKLNEQSEIANKPYLHNAILLPSDSVKKEERKSESKQKFQPEEILKYSDNDLQNIQNVQKNSETIELFE